MQLVNIERYPIADLTTPAARALVRLGRDTLEHDGSFTLPEFVAPAALARMQTEANRLSSVGFKRQEMRNAIPSGKPRETRVSLASVGLDQMSRQGDMRRLFLWEPMTRFVGAVLERYPYHRSADPIASCMVTVLDVGDELGWHFDANDGIVTLMLQSPGTGGAFEYVPGIRDHHELESELDRVLEGDRDGVCESDYLPGTLALFNGFQALHRVSPVEQGPARLILIFSYDSEPRQHFGDEVRQRFFGRTEPLSSRSK